MLDIALLFIGISLLICYGYFSFKKITIDDHIFKGRLCKKLLLCERNTIKHLISKDNLRVLERSTHVSYDTIMEYLSDNNIDIIDNNLVQKIIIENSRKTNSFKSIYQVNALQKVYQNTCCKVHNMIFPSALLPEIIGRLLTDKYADFTFDKIRISDYSYELTY